MGLKPIVYMSYEKKNKRKKDQCSYLTLMTKIIMYIFASKGTITQAANLNSTLR